MKIDNSDSASHEPPPPLPQLTEDEIKRSGYGQVFSEALVGTEWLEIVLKCRECGEVNTIGMWDFAGRFCPECGSSKGAERI